MGKRRLEPLGLATLGETRLGMNKLESRYAQHLDLLKLAGDVREWKYEWLRFRLADGAWYKPDFFLVMPDRSMELHETKGVWREAARVRIRVAAERHPWFRFRGVQHSKRSGWVFEDFSHKEGT